MRVTNTRVSVALLMGLCLVPAPMAAGDEPPASEQPSGRELYLTYCATCHGRSARGDGPLADYLRKPPPDLTLFAERNGGVYPSALVHRLIDGRQPMPGHGGPDMPVWGDAFKPARPGSSEAIVKARIDALVEYLGSIQRRKAEGRPERWRLAAR